MSGRNCVRKKYAIGDVLETGYVLMNKMTGHIIFRPDRGSQGYAMWRTEGNAQRECSDDECVVKVEMRLKILEMPLPASEGGNSICDCGRSGCYFCTED